MIQWFNLPVCWIQAFFNTNQFERLAFYVFLLYSIRCTLRSFFLLSSVFFFYFCCCCCCYWCRVLSGEMDKIVMAQLRYRDDKERGICCKIDGHNAGKMKRTVKTWLASILVTCHLYFHRLSFPYFSTLCVCVFCFVSFKQTALLVGIRLLDPCNPFEWVLKTFKTILNSLIKYLLIISQSHPFCILLFG